MIHHLSFPNRCSTGGLRRRRIQKNAVATVKRKEVIVKGPISSRSHRPRMAFVDQASVAMLTRITPQALRCHDEDVFPSDLRVGLTDTPFLRVGTKWHSRKQISTRKKSCSSCLPCRSLGGGRCSCHNFPTLTCTQTGINSV